MDGNFRGAYNRTALLVVAFDEMLASQNLINEGAYISQCIEKYPRRSAFRRELNNYIM